MELLRRLTFGRRRPVSPVEHAPHQLVQRQHVALHWLGCRGLYDAGPRLRRSDKAISPMRHSNPPNLVDGGVEIAVGNARMRHMPDDVAAIDALPARAMQPQ